MQYYKHPVLHNSIVGGLFRYIRIINNNLLSFLIYVHSTLYIYKKSWLMIWIYNHWFRFVIQIVGSTSPQLSVLKLKCTLELFIELRTSEIISYTKKVMMTMRLLFWVLSEMKKNKLFSSDLSITTKFCRCRKSWHHTFHTVPI